MRRVFGQVIRKKDDMYIYGFKRENMKFHMQVIYNFFLKRNDLVQDLTSSCLKDSYSNSKNWDQNVCHRLSVT